ncbi:N-acetylmuramoyl-L-alanine amidase [Gracilibacillus ureilyticus]|uniref:N-acetylmuramoyl-L-alanine amidase n=1 Tax=Gracilibacillus ureilyticus TaxID=531814 RepID=A0A1H9RLM7_9BACI|nr:N-acetylmuramoyl-L-alanine amidase [Gracilibacillus ureilyticus]SER73672.1 N-acetylmuramoyl-L-alanine amidase [Gracilibacillus ureilyticus]
MGKKGWIAILFGLMLIFSSSFIIYAKDAYIDGENLNVRNGPGTDFPVIGQVHPPDVYPVLEETEGWVKIEYQQETGWVAKDYVTIKEKTEVNEKSSREIKVDPSPVANIKPKGLEGKIVVIDPGHGGRDVGAISVMEKYESSYTLKTAEILADLLKEHGAIVKLTREDDRYISLLSRSTYSNTLHADVFLSLHYNSTPDYPDVSGAGTFYYNDRDQKLAELVQQAMITETEMEDRGVMQADLQVLRTNHRPGLLLELGFISNEQEEEHIQSEIFQKAMSRGIVTGLAQYFQ